MANGLVDWTLRTVTIGLVLPGQGVRQLRRLADAAERGWK
jgi:hypothetical protein